MMDVREWLSRLAGDPNGVLTMQLSLVGQAYREDAAVVIFQERLLEQVRTMPGTEAVALAGQIPMGGNGDTWGFHVEGKSSANPSDDPAVERYSVSPDYFRVMRIPLVRGRLIIESDAAASAGRWRCSRRSPRQPISCPRFARCVSIR
jgi:hypothetical protein